MKRRSRVPALASTALIACCALFPPAAGAVDRTSGAEIARPALAGVPWSLPARARLVGDIDALLAGAATLRGAHVGLLAVDTRSGEVLYARNPDDAFVPASTMKLLTGSVALAQLGAGYRFHTEAAFDATGTDLVIRAGGDPLLGVADLAALAQAVRTSGTTRIARGVSVDTSRFAATPYAPGWSWDDLPYDYAPVLSAAAIEENVVHLTIVPGDVAGAPVRVTVAPLPFATAVPGATCPPTPRVVVVTRATTSARGSTPDLDLTRAAGGCIEVVGTLPLDAEPQTLDAAVPSPVWYLRALAEAALRNAGVGVGAGVDDNARTWPASGGGEPVPDSARVLWTHDGEPLADLLADMWWPSDNFVAEQLLEAIAVGAGGVPGSIERGAAAERVWLSGIGVDPATLTIADGSGLSTYDRLTPRALVAILQADWSGPDRTLVIDDLPLAGVRGTLAHSFAGSLAERRTFAKTGSVMHARGLAGYLATEHHGALTFAWSIDDWLGNDADLATLRERVLSRLIGD